MNDFFLQSVVVLRNSSIFRVLESLIGDTKPSDKDKRGEMCVDEAILAAVAVGMTLSGWKTRWHEMHKRFIGFASIRSELKSKYEKTSVMRKENHCAEECETGCESCGGKESGKLGGKTLKNEIYLRR